MALPPLELDINATLLSVEPLFSLNYLKLAQLLLFYGVNEIGEKIEIDEFAG